MRQRTGRQINIVTRNNAKQTLRIILDSGSFSDASHANSQNQENFLRMLKRKNGNILLYLVIYGVNVYRG